MQQVYTTPFPMAGAAFTHEGTEYRLGGKAEALAFRLLADSLDGFTLRSEKNSIYVWDKHIKGESMNLIKVFGLFDVDSSAMWDMLQDAVFRIKWDENRVDSFQVVRMNANNDIGYYAAKSPSGISNRDFLNQRSWHSAGNGEYVIFNTSVAHAAVPATKEGFVRAISKVSGYLIRPWTGATGSAGGPRCSVTYITLTDPKGWIPHMVLNYVTSKFAPTTMVKIRKASQEFTAWLTTEEGLKSSKDWAVTEDPWTEGELPDVVHDFVLHRMERGDDATPIPAGTPVSPAANNDFCAE